MVVMITMVTMMMLVAVLVTVVLIVTVLVCFGDIASHCVGDGVMVVILRGTVY